MAGPYFVGNIRLDFGDWGGDVGRVAITLTPLYYNSGEGWDLTIPVGTMSDGITIPRFLWWFLPPWGDKATVAGILHDLLCDIQRTDNKIKTCETRAGCDRQARRAFIACGVPKFNAWLVWVGIRTYSIFYAGLIQGIK